MTGSAFDALAPQYDALWTNSPAGHKQRKAVWRQIDPLLKAGDQLLDIGCGSGEDAVHFGTAGIRVDAIDVSAKMVAIARDRGVSAKLLAAEDIHKINETFDAVISNFGALNCVEDLDWFAAIVARLVKPGGVLAICLMSPFCGWETAWYLLHRDSARAFRRWTGKSLSQSLGITVYYPSAAKVIESFSPYFALRTWCGIGASSRRPT